MKRTKKNAQGAGTIRKRSDGRWEARFTTGYDPATGKQIQKSIYGKTQKEVREELRAMTAEVDQGTYQEPCKMTVEEWLDIWLKEYTGNTKPHTRKSYEAVIQNHIIPALGSQKLSALSSVAVQKFVNHLENQKDNQQPLNPKTIKNIHGVLHSALQQAVRIGLLRVNPADYTVLPKRTKAEIMPLQDEEVGRFLATIQGHPFEYIYLTDLFTGLRQSEILGLTWEDINFSAGHITVRRQLQFLGSKYGGYRFTTPKNNKIRQIFPAKYVMDILKKQQRRQLEMRLAAGAEWNNPDDLVFTDALGGHLKHDLIYRHVKRIFAQIGCPNRRFHDLRHSYAVLAIQAGDDIKTVQENLGHYSAAFTLDVYGHVTDQMKRDSADRMERHIKKVSGCSR